MKRRGSSSGVWRVLHRLIGNNYQFTVSTKARENMETVKRSSNNVIDFMESEGYFRF